MIRSSIKKTLFLFTLLSIFYNLNAQVVSSVQNTEFDTCGETLPSSELNLGNLVLSETLSNDFLAGTYTFFIEAPSNFEINANLASYTGTDISSINVTQASGNAARLEITITVDTDTSIDELTIENVRIQNTTGAVTTNSEIIYVLNGNSNNINALSDNDILETLTFNQFNGGTGVDQQVCAIADVQNIGVQGSNITQNRTFEWEIDDNGSWVIVSNSNQETLVINNATFSNGITRYRRSTTTIVNGETCKLVQYNSRNYGQ